MSGNDLDAKDQCKELEKVYHGNDNIGSQVKLLIAGMGIYEPMFIPQDVHRTGSSNVSELPLVLASPFNVDEEHWVLKENITAQLLSHTNKKEGGTGTLLTGRNILKYSQNNNREAKKILSLVPEAVKAKILERPVDGEYAYASGKNVGDLIHFLRLRMKNWDVFNGPTGATIVNDKSNDNPPHTANVLIEAVNDLEWDTSSDNERKTATGLIYNACTSGSVTVAFKEAKSSALKTIFSYIAAEGDATAADVLYEIVNKNELASDDYDADEVKEAVEYFRRISNPEQTKMKSYKKHFYPLGWCVFWLQGPLAPRKNRLNILELDDGTDRKKEDNSGRKNHRENEKKLKDDERSTGAANGGGRGIAYRDQKDLALIAQQQRKQDQHDFVAKMAQISTVLKSLEATRESTMKMASEWRLGGDMDQWRNYMNKVESLGMQIESKRNELDVLEHRTRDDTSHVDSFLSIGTDTSGTKSTATKPTSANEPASAKKTASAKTTTSAKKAKMITSAKKATSAKNPKSTTKRKAVDLTYSDSDDDSKDDDSDSEDDNSDSN